MSSDAELGKLVRRLVELSEVGSFVDDHGTLRAAPDGKWYVNGVSSEEKWLLGIVVSGGFDTPEEALLFALEGGNLSE
jgi:hypothetical protein